ncbi:MAG: phosphate signaling complex protein PhoU [Flavobacteriales bacterium]|nr:phosphate signaling complex protein PhoU [Flavobacteriales bacterium]
MVHHEQELLKLKGEMIQLWHLVIAQLHKSKQALLTLDMDMAREIIFTERRVNAFELNIDNECENIFALLNPVAVDLRFVLAVLKINSNLERTGDIAEGIAKFVLEADKPFDTKLLEVTQVLEMFEEAADMLIDLLKAFEEENTKIARGIFKRDEFLNEINMRANEVITEYISSTPNNIGQALHILSTIRKLERVGDQSKNIGEEIIFYVEAKVLKHASQSTREDD